MRDVYGELGDPVSTVTFTPSNAIKLQPWTRPRDARLIFMFLVGGGGGGGLGQGTTAGTSRTGGGGGGTGSLAWWLVPAFVLPEVLYASPGNGGAGSAAGGASNICYANTTSDFMVQASAGGAGTAGASGGTAGSGGAASSTGPFRNGGMVFVEAGVNGGAGGVGDNPGANVTAFSNRSITGGAGGGGCLSTDQTGGSIVPADSFYMQNLVGGAATSGLGLPGITFARQYYGALATGGTGGGSINTGTGGKGGPGAVGCGGGGGGVGTTGGAGGTGGSGLIVIQWWS